MRLEEIGLNRQMALATRVICMRSSMDLHCPTLEFSVIGAIKIGGFIRSRQPLDHLGFGKILGGPVIAMMCLENRM